MKKKLSIYAGLGLLLFYCVVLLFPWDSPKSAFYLYQNIREDLKYRIGESAPDMTDAYFDSCIKMGANAVLGHGLAGILEGEFTLVANEKYRSLLIGGTPYKILSIKSLTEMTSSSYYLDEKGVPSINIKDIGQKSLDVKAPHSFHFFYYDQDTPWVFVYPPHPTSTRQFYFSYYIERMENLSSPGSAFQPCYNEALINYAAMMIWLRLKNFTEAAEAYNNYQREISRMRGERVGQQPDISIEQKTIK